MAANYNPTTKDTGQLRELDSNKPGVSPKFIQQVMDDYELSQETEDKTS